MANAPIRPAFGLGIVWTCTPSMTISFTIRRALDAGRLRTRCRPLMILMFLWLLLPLNAGDAAATSPTVPPPPTTTPDGKAASLLEGLAGNDRSAALDAIAAGGDAALLPALDAFAKGMLAKRDGRFVMYASKIEVSGRGMVYPVLDALSGQPMRDTAGAALYEDSLPSDAIKAKSAERKRVKAIAAALQLRHPDPLQRRQAIITVADNADADLLMAMEQQLASDPQGPDAVLLRESIARIRLVTGNPAEVLTAVQTLGQQCATRAHPALLERRTKERLALAHRERDAALCERLAGQPAATTLAVWQDTSDDSKPTRDLLATFGMPGEDPVAIATTIAGKAQIHAADLRQQLDSPDPLLSALERAVSTIESRQAWAQRVQQAFAGLSLGSILILLALGLSIIFGLMGVINMAHGELMMIGAFTSYLVSQGFATWLPGWYDWYLVAAIPAAALVAGGVGWLIEMLVIRHLYGRPLETLLATFGIGLILIQTVRVCFGDNLAVKPPSWLTGGIAVTDDIVLPANRLFIIALCAGCVAGMYLVIRATRLGLLLRATTQNRQMAACLGVATRRIDGMTFALGAGLAGMAGVAVPLYDKISPTMGQNVIVESFLVVVTGGVGNLAGVVWAGLGLGFTSKLIEPWLEVIFTKITLLGMIIIFLQWRPSGLFPAKGRLADV